MLPEDPILLPEIIDHVFLVAVHPASGREYEEAQSVGHSLRLLGKQPLAPTLFRRFANLGRFVAPYEVVSAATRALAAEARGEMGDPAAGGALGPELPDLIVLEVGVAELAQGRPLGAEGARGRARAG